jgi:hypothetical protein
MFDAPSLAKSRVALCHWAVGMEVRNLGPGFHERAHDQMVTMSMTRPAGSAIVLGGLLYQLAATLPQDDAWRQLSARVGRLTRGPTPPESDGAINLQGLPFGTVNDGLDRITDAIDPPTNDPSLAPLWTPLSPTAAGLIGVAGGDLAETIIAVREVYASNTAPVAIDDDFNDSHPATHFEDEARDILRPGAWANRVAGHCLFRETSDAISWLLWRRSTYQGGLPSTYVVDSAMEWLTIASRLTRTTKPPYISPDVVSGLVAEGAVFEAHDGMWESDDF